MSAVQEGKYWDGKDLIIPVVKVSRCSGLLSGTGGRDEHQKRDRCRLPASEILPSVRHRSSDLDKPSDGRGIGGYEGLWLELF